MPGGENFERARLTKDTKLTSYRFKKYVDEFKRGYFKFSRLLFNKTEMERLGCSEAYGIYNRLCKEDKLDKCLGRLYRIVGFMPWLTTDQDCIDLICSDPQWGNCAVDYDTYTDLLQNILSVIEENIGTFGRVSGNMKSKMGELRKIVRDCESCFNHISVPLFADDYISAASWIAFGLKRIVDICKELNMI